jgi:hypothetical protein
VAAIQRSTKWGAKEHTSDGDGCTSMALNTEELVLTSGREASPELGSTNGSMFSGNHGVSQISLSPVSVREVSPDLGSVNGLSGSYNHGSRKRFFETFSQLPLQPRQPETPKSRRLGVINSASSAGNSNNTRILPWTKSDSPRSSNLPRSQAKFASPIASMRKDRGQLLSTGQRDVSSPSRQPRGPSTPFARSESSRPLKRVKANMPGEPHDHPSAPKRHSMPASNVNPRSQQNLQKAIKSERLTPGRSMVQAFMAQRNKNGSTPKTTPGKRFCTKPIETLPRRLEPETQGWDT